MTQEINHDRLRVGVLGAGPIGQFAHLEGCRKARNVELYGICDRAEDLLERVAAAHPPRQTYTSYEAMLADPNIDAVIVAIADQFHVGAARQAVAAGKHVLVEKPMGVTVEECEELVRAVHDAGVVLQVGTQRRYDPNIAYAADFIRHDMGEVLAMRAWYCDSSYRYTVTDAVQPLPITSDGAIRPEGNPKADSIRYYLPVTAAISWIRRSSCAGRSPPCARSWLRSSAPTAGSSAWTSLTVAKGISTSRWPCEWTGTRASTSTASTDRSSRNR